MVEETGTIIAINKPNVAVVLCKKSSMCENCAAAASCRLDDDGSERRIEVFNTLGAQVGDRVRIVTSTRNFLHSSFLLYVLPLLFLVAGAVLGQFIGEKIDGGSDPNLLSALFGVSALVAGFVVVRVATRNIPRQKFMPHIADILAQTQSCEDR